MYSPLTFQQIKDLDPNWRRPVYASKKELGRLGH